MRFPKSIASSPLYREQIQRRWAHLPETQGELSAAALGFVHVPQRPVEAVIALSIVFVAVEIVRIHRGLKTITARAPWLVALTFGLMHGLGFASGLSEAGLPQGHIPTALLFSVLVSKVDTSYSSARYCR